MLNRHLAYVSSDHSVKPDKTIKSRIDSRQNAVISLRPPFPDKQMNIELSNICNHKCNFCPSSKLTRERRFIDKDIVFRILREAYDLGTREVTWHIMGEPFANQNLKDYIKYAKDLGYTYVYLTTNGSLATREKLDEVFEAGLDSVKFSINAGTRESYKQIHGRDDFETVKQNVIYCNEYRNKHNKDINLYISYVVIDNNINDVYCFKKEFSPLVDDIVFYGMLNRGGLMPESRALINNLPDSFNENKIAAECTQPFNTIFVTCEGYLSPCCMDTDLNLMVADLNTIALNDAWYGEKMTALRKRHIDKDFKGIQCERCLACGSDRLTILDI